MSETQYTPPAEAQPQEKLKPFHFELVEAEVIPQIKEIQLPPEVEENLVNLLDTIACEVYLDTVKQHHESQGQAWTDETEVQATQEFLQHLHEAGWLSRLTTTHPTIKESLSQAFAHFKADILAATHSP